ncbi:MAG: hypothetical protein HYZ40_13725, partial [Rhodospirillales bacterium]|nr:hypothetical protein [Rhodospirillales bacterium]
DLWERYIDPAFRDRAIHLRTNAEGLELLGRLDGAELAGPEATLEVPANGEARVDWRVRVTRPGEAKLVLKAVGPEFGDAVERIAVVCGSARTAPHNFVFLEGVRSAVQAARTPEEGLRAMGRIYAGWALSQTFYRREMWRGLGFASLEDFLVRSWEANFVRRDARDLMAQLWTWQNGDISANDLYRGDLAMALAGIKAKVLLMPSATDLYFQTDDNRAELPHLRDAKLVEIPSVWGHRAGNPLANPEDAAFVDAQVEALLNA